MNNPHNVLIGSGYYDDAGTAPHCQWFHRIWMANAPTGIPLSIVDNSHSKYASSLYLGGIQVSNNLGHVGGNIGNNLPRLMGWSMSWIIPAMVAYSEGMDFIYKEQDCLAFGNWVDVLVGEANDRELDVAFGVCPHEFAWCEQSLFFVRRDAIPGFVGRYCCMPDGDAVKLPETKFRELMMRRDSRIGEFTRLPGGRTQPRPWGEPAFYGQKYTPDEMDRLALEGLITLP